ncbi:hypothetical protein HHI36_000835 [Cryptolaemus montrouzieri]|uniref:Uncharacterized protein n=1 Tax=Cryptolaemus montrouzieri TaxID=559131 RepID=A0ABD2P5V2_9CUCU
MKWLYTENSTTIDIKNCDKNENGNENVDNENQMSYVKKIIIIRTNEYSAAKGIGNCGDNESGAERVENKNQMSMAENTEINVKYEEKQRSYVKNESRSKGNFQYRLQRGNDKMKVCKNMFLSTLGLKERSVREWVTNPTVHGMPRTKDEKKKTIKQIKDDKSKTTMISFINSIPKLSSHYCRALQTNYI